MHFVDSDLRARLHAARLVFMDCDGVIFASNGFKCRAMDRVLSDYPEALRQQMTKYWRNNGGMSRRVKFEYFFRELVQSSDWQSLTDLAVARFGGYSLEGFLDVEPAPLALVFARHVGRERLVVVSGADQAELAQVFHRKQLNSLFPEVLGAPIKKQQLVENVLAYRGLGPDAAVLIGDGARDFEVCQRLGMHFVYLHEYSEWDGAALALADAPDVSWANRWSELLEAAGFGDGE